MNAYYQFDRENLVKRWFGTDKFGCYRLTTTRLNKETLIRQTVHSAFMPDSMEWMVGIYLTQFHGSDTIPTTGPVTENDILEIIAENERSEQIPKDACRYRLLKGIALQKGALEATIAMEQLDFISDPEKFDAVVDRLEQRITQQGR